jgi:FixJ family two-component response regulator
MSAYIKEAACPVSRASLIAFSASLIAASPREREIMVHVVRGRLSKQIATDLGISETTVKVHRSSLSRKMKARSLSELTRMADKLKLAAGRVC